MAFLIFPAEVWEMIIGELDESIDVSNTFNAYPELDVKGALRRKLHLSLFDQVFGYVFPWLTEDDILDCREVCRSFKETVDNYWANNPDYRAFQHGDTLTGRNRIHPAHPSHFHLDEYFPRQQEFSSLEICREFLQDMENHPIWRNPFLGRSVVISQDGVLSNGIETFWNDGLLEVFRKFGEHVWFLRLRIAYQAAALCPTHLLLKCLPYFSNLKSLEIATRLKSNEINRFLHSDPLPEFPQLETLELSDHFMEQDVVDLFLLKYSNQLRRLIMHIKYWKTEYSKLFPELTELWLCGASGGKELMDLLRFIEAPKLHSLEIEFSGTGGNGPEESRFYVDSIFPLLTSFPQISSAVFTSSTKLRLGGVMSSESDQAFSVPSLKSLVIWSDDGHHHEIGHLAFGCFPALEYLKVAGKVEVEQLWRILPRLRVVTVKEYYGKQSIHRREL